jgi:hypothetical protein
MWNWFNCRVSGRHEYGVSCEPGAVFLRCIHCKTRSSGWAVDPSSQRRQPVEREPARPERPASVPRPTRAATRLEFPQHRTENEPRAVHATAVEGQVESARILPFVRKRQPRPDRSQLRQAG